MTNDTDIDFEAAGDVQNAIEAAGGNVREFEMKEVQRELGGMMGHLMAVMGGKTERRYVFEVAIEGPTTGDIDIDPQSQIDGDDALAAIAAAASWADDEGLDALTADLSDVYQRLGQQVHGDAHPTDEMTTFQEQADQAGDVDD